MAVREIIRMGHPTLRQEARALTEAEVRDAAFSRLITDMRDTLHSSGGIGLAAPQINEPIQVAVIEISDPASRYGEIPLIPFSIYVNPVIEVISSESRGFWEGCLSVPGLRGFVERPQHIRVTYRDEHFAPQTMELTDFAATVFQHEFDHLKGILYLDRMTDMTRLAFEEEFMQFQLDA